MLGLKAHVVMPRPISAFKQASVSRHGASVWIADHREAAQRMVEDIVREEQAVFVHAFNDPAVMAGQGTIMPEFLNQAERLEIILAPVGGGGLLSGLCVAGHHLQPALRLFACEPAGAADAVESLRSNRVVPMPHPQTRADGLRTSLGDRTLPILRRHLAGVFLVTEEEIVESMRFAYERLKIVIEPSSAVALAPILRGEPELIGRRIGVVLTGGNADLDPLWSKLAESFV
jgi:threonine dehydratase